MTPTKWQRKDLLGIDDLSVEEIELILETARSFHEVTRRPVKKVPTLRGKTVLNLFFEASTRTRSSFEIAEKRMSADAINFSTSSSSLSKGESLLDTTRNLEAMAPDVLVVRHGHPFVPHQLAARVSTSVVNAGDGAHEHPTQALLDAFTILQHRPTLEGLRVAIVGDIEHSRVVRSNVLLLQRMGASVVLGGPRTMLPPDAAPALGVDVVTSLDEAIEGADVVMMLRVQFERQNAMLIPSADEYFALFGLNLERLARASDDVLVMHPGPLNRGVEIASEVADSGVSLILDQVMSGLAVRMAVLYLLAGGAS